MTPDEAIALARKHGLPVDGSPFNAWAYSPGIIDAIMEAATLTPGRRKAVESAYHAARKINVQRLRGAVCAPHAEVDWLVESKDVLRAWWYELQGSPAPAPPARPQGAPLTDVQINAAMHDPRLWPHDFEAGVRFAEQHHGVSNGR